MRHSKGEQNAPRANGLEDNLKKALTELLILFLFSEEEHYIGELAPLLHARSHGVLTIVFPYAAIYRLTQADYLTETKRKPPRTGGCGSITTLLKKGRAYLQDLLATYRTFFQGIDDILSGEVAP